MNTAAPRDFRPRWMALVDCPVSQVATSAILVFATWVALGFFDGRMTQGVGHALLTSAFATVVGVGFFQFVAFIVRRASSYRPPRRQQ